MAWSYTFHVKHTASGRSGVCSRRPGVPVLSGDSGFVRYACPDAVRSGREAGTQSLPAAGHGSLKLFLFYIRRQDPDGAEVSVGGFASA